MSVSQDLFTAILSMDAYNRGYNAGIGTNTDGLGSSFGIKIGDASIIAASDSSITSEARAAGFYAIAYNWDSTTVIAYRGTDRNISSPWSDNIGSDIWNAYGQGLGLVTTQARMAAEFYQAVTGTQDSLNPTNPNTITTGHSLGGGLAGFIAAVYGQKAVI